ncbi:hypothetical protein AQUCO_04100153v1 [Aquilegia coerulea]|uniref:Uncharacterized protein n=1 Tax=Aquilegia coerulea TaxID=218851 RepID=A0A2G5CQE2_AQUCA|nr:hypothetical protein AQUCO_04100153v1 [Aquilegia coerulea]
MKSNKICVHSQMDILNELTARKYVSFQTALSKLRFALLPRNIGFVRSVSIRFISNRTLFFPVVSGL